MIATNNMLRLLLALFCFGAFVSVAAPFALALEEQDPHEAMRDSLKSLSNAELEEMLFQPTPPQPTGVLQNFRQRQALEMARGYLLSQILQRDKAWSIPLLQRAVRTLRPKSRENAGKDQGCDIAILTALRRAEGLPDPIAIVINADAPLPAMPRDQLSVLKIAVKNVDAQKQTVFLDSDGHPLARWRLVYKDQQGQEAKVLEKFVWSNQRSSGPLKADEEWKTELDVRDLIEPPAPGAGTLQLLFHNEYALSGLKDLSSLIVCQSKVVNLVIEKTRLQITASEAALARRLIAELDGDAPLKIVAGTYGEWAHGLIPRDSPAGKLLELGAPAVPTLIAAVQDEKISPAKQAWLLSLLYSLTGENDPRQDFFALSSFTYLEGPFEVWTSKERKPPPGDVSRSGRGTRTSNRPVDHVRLQKLASTWKAWLAANCEVREVQEK